MDGHILWQVLNFKNLKKLMHISPIDSWRFLPKMHFLNILEFLTLTWAKLALIYSKRHLQHGSKPFFPLAPCFMTFSLGHAQKSKF